MHGRREMLSWFYRGEIETRRYTVIISSLMGACSRVRTAGLRLPKAHRSPSASPQPWGAPLPPPFPESLAVSQGSCWVQWILLLCLVLFLTPNEVSSAESCKALSEIHPLDGNCGPLYSMNPPRLQALISLGAVQTKS